MSFMVYGWEISPAGLASRFGYKGDFKGEEFDNYLRKFGLRITYRPDGMYTYATLLKEDVQRITLEELPDVPKKVLDFMTEPELIVVDNGPY